MQMFRMMSIFCRLTIHGPAPLTNNAKVSSSGKVLPPGKVLKVSPPGKLLNVWYNM